MATRSETWTASIGGLEVFEAERFSRRPALLALLAAVAVCLGATAVPRDAVASTRPPSAFQPTVAKRLATTLAGAKTDATRQRAVKGVLKAVGIPIVDGRGRLLASGYGASPLYVYDFEVFTLAQGRDTSSAVFAQGLTAAISRAKLPVKAGGLTVGDANGLIASSVSWARRHPRDPRALPGLLEWQLGLRRGAPVDLTRATSAAIALSPLQLLLMTYQLAADMETFHLPRSTAAVASIASVGSACDGIGKLIKKGGERVTQAKEFIERVGIKETAEKVLEAAIPAAALRQLRRAAKWGLEVAAMGKVLADYAHGLQIALSFSFHEVDADNTHTTTHFGPAGHPGAANAGQPLVYRVEMEMLIDPPEELVRCGALLGLKLPAKAGGVPDIPIDWKPLLGGDYDALKGLGAITREDSVTNDEGIAELDFQPSAEVSPGLGAVREQRGFLRPVAEPFAALGNAVGWALDKAGVFDLALLWDVSWHDNHAALRLHAAIDKRDMFSSPTSGKDIEAHVELTALVPLINGKGGPVPVNYDTASYSELWTYLTGGNCQWTQTGRLASTTPGTLSATIEPSVVGGVIDYKVSLTMPDMPLELIHHDSSIGPPCEPDSASSDDYGDIADFALFRAFAEQFGQPLGGDQTAVLTGWPVLPSAKQALLGPMDPFAQKVANWTQTFTDQYGETTTYAATVTLALVPGQ